MRLAHTVSAMAANEMDERQLPDLFGGVLTPSIRPLQPGIGLEYINLAALFVMIFITGVLPGCLKPSWQSDGNIDRIEDRLPMSN